MRLWQDGITAVYWTIWTAFFYIHCRRIERLAVLRRMVGWVLGGSLLQLPATVPSHMIVIRRGGCFVGLLAGGGLLAGLYVMTWVFGPGIALLFWAEISRRTHGHCPACGYDLHGLSEPRCPECGRPFTFQEVRATPEELGYTGKQPHPNPHPALRAVQSRPWRHEHRDLQGGPCSVAGFGQEAQQKGRPDCLSATKTSLGGRGGSLARNRHFDPRTAFLLPTSRGASGRKNMHKRLPNNLALSC